MRPDTLCIHGVKDNNNQTGALCVPIYQSATFAHPGVGQSTGYDYSRVQNPTRECLEKAIAQLENGCDALAFSTGMAATTALMELLSQGTGSLPPMICMAVQSASLSMFRKKTD